MSVFMVFTISSVKVNADSSVDTKKETKTKKTLEFDKSNELDRIVLESEAYQELIAKDPTYELVSRDRLYYKIEKVEGKTKKTAFTEEQYDKEMLKEKEEAVQGITTDKSYGWIYVSMYGLVNYSGSYFISFSYSWLQVPFFASTDALVIGAADSLPITSESLKVKHTVVADTTYEYNYSWSSPDMKSRGTNTYGINVPLKVSGIYATTKCSGIISANAIRESSNITAAKIFGSYGHRELTISSTSFSFSASGLSFSFPLGLTYDEAPVSTTLSVY